MEDSATCRTCKKVRKVSEFAKHKNVPLGRDTQCNYCKSKYYKIYYQKNKEYIKERTRKYSKTPTGRTVKRRSSHNNYRKYKNKWITRAKTQYMVKKGVIKKKPCKKCGDKKSQAHHVDYSDPLKVIWLCEAHHKQTHYKTPRIKVNSQK